MQDHYGIAAFRSRQQVLRLEAALRRQGIPVQVVSTPRQISMGCGLSARFPLEYASQVKKAVSGLGTGNLIGLYRAGYDGGRLVLTVL